MTVMETQCHYDTTFCSCQHLRVGGVRSQALSPGLGWISLFCGRVSVANCDPMDGHDSVACKNRWQLVMRRIMSETCLSMNPKRALFSRFCDEEVLGTGCGVCVWARLHTQDLRVPLRRLRTSRQSTPTANETVEHTVADIEASVAGSNPLPTPSTVPASASRRRRRRLGPLPWSWDSDTEPDGPVQTHRHRRCVVPRAAGELPSTVPASPGDLFSAGLMPEHEFPTSGTQLSRRRVLSVPEDVVDSLESGLAVEDQDGPAEVFAMTDDAPEEFEGRPQMGRRVTPRSHFNDSNSVEADAFDRHSQSTISALEPLGDEAASSDTETIGGISDVSIGGGPISEAEPVPVVEEVSMGPAFRDALRWLDTVDLTGIFARRALVMRSPPRFLCGGYRAAMR